MIVFYCRHACFDTLLLSIYNIKYFFSISEIQVDRDTILVWKVFQKKNAII